MTSISPDLLVGFGAAFAARTTAVCRRIASGIGSPNHPRCRTGRTPHSLDLLDGLDEPSGKLGEHHVAVEGSTALLSFGALIEFEHLAREFESVRELNHRPSPNSVSLPRISE
jgi:hypothetical protein